MLPQRGFIKLFEAHQKSMKVNSKFIFILIQISEMYKAGRVDILFSNISEKDRFQI